MAHKLFIDMDLKYELMDKVTTAENIANWIWGKLINAFPDDVDLHSIKLYETPTSWVEIERQ